MGKGQPPAAARPIDALRLELQGRLDEQAQSIEAVRGQVGGFDERLGKLGQDVGVNATSIKELRNTLDDTAKKIFNNLIGDAETDDTEGDGLDDGMARRLDRIEARLGLKPGRAAKPASSPSPPPAPDPVTTPPTGSPAPPSPPVPAPPLAAVGIGGLGSLVAVVLVTLLLPGFTLMEMSAIETWAWPQAGLRNLVTAAAAALAYFVIGYAVTDGAMPFAAGSAQARPEEAANLYQLCRALAATLIVATICSNRLSVPASAFMAVVVAGLAYPALGHWCWAGLAAPDRLGWLERQGFRDFAGASVIQSFGAWFALAWVWRFPMARQLTADELGDRGQFLAPFAMFLLGLGWLGLVAGGDGSGELASARPVVNVLLAGAGALLASLAYLMTPVGTRSDDGVLSRYPAGALAGLVAVSAGADRFMPVEALVIGVMAGLLQSLAYRALAAKVVRGDQVAANLIAAFGVCGILGTVSVSVFGTEGTFSRVDFDTLGVQGMGVGVTLAFGLSAGLLTALACEGFTRLRSFRKSRSCKGAAVDG
ncbi:MAG: hypothetical protein ACKN9W_14890 [Methylococcus sp.]